MSKPTRKDAYNALWELLLTVPPPKGMTWGMQEQRAKVWSKVSPGSQPAMFMQQVVEIAEGRRKSGLITWEWHVLVLIYFRANTIPDQDSWDVLNDFLDSFDTTIQGFAGENQTLGNIIYDCYVEGTVGLYEGQGDPNQAIIAIPIVMLTGL